jgi:hypothetical protein
VLVMVHPLKTASPLDFYQTIAVLEFGKVRELCVELIGD